MTKQKGRAFLIRIGDGATPLETFTPLAGLTAKSLGIANERIDTTVPDANPLLPIWRTSLDGATAFSVSGDFLLTAEAVERRLLDVALNQVTKSANFEIFVPSVGTFSGLFAVTELQYSAEGAVSGSLTLENIGPVTVDAAADPLPAPPAIAITPAAATIPEGTTGQIATIALSGTGISLAAIAGDAALFTVSGTGPSRALSLVGPATTGTRSITYRVTDAAGQTAQATHNLTIEAAATDGPTAAGAIGLSIGEEATIAGQIEARFTQAVKTGERVRVIFSNDPTFDPVFERDGVDYVAGNVSAEIPGPGVPFLSSGRFAGEIFARGFVVGATAVDGDWPILSAGPDISFFIRPVLSAASVTPNGPTEFSARVATTGAGGALSWYASANPVPPSNADLTSGAGAVAAGSVPVGPAGQIDFVGAGLLAGTSYFLHLVHRLADDTISAAFTSPQFTTAAAATVPSAFTAAQWALVPLASVGGDALQIDVASLPADQGAALTRLEYRIDSNAATLLADPPALGSTQITVLADTATGVQLRAVNAQGAGPWSDLKTETPQRVGGTSVTSVQIDGRTFTFDAPQTIVRHVDGAVAIVAAGAVNVTLPVATAGRDGAMINPQGQDSGDLRSGLLAQGFDDRRPWYSAALRRSGTVTLQPGDVLVASRSVAGSVGSQNGETDSYQAIYVTSTAPAAASLPPALIGWPGRAGLALEGAVDWDARLAQITARAVTSTRRPLFADVIRGLRTNLGYPMFINTFKGYEDASPNTWGGPNLPGLGGNWGGFMAMRFSEAVACLMDSAFSTAERRAILVAIASFGKQLYLTREALDNVPGEDGGHNQIVNAAVQTYLWVTGQAAALDALMPKWAGAYDQAFLMDLNFIDRNAPWGSPANLSTGFDLANPQPYYARRRPVNGVSGNDVTIQVWRGSGNIGDGQKSRYSGLEWSRDGVNWYLCTADNTDIAQGFGTKTITIPGHNFQTGDTVFARAQYTLAAGDPEWSIRSIASRPFSFVPSASTSYRKDPRWTLPLLLMYATGQFRAGYAAAVAYSEKANLADTPTPQNDWTNATQRDSLARDFYDQHGATILALPQGAPAGVTPEAPLLVTHAYAPGTASPGPLVDGVVIGLVPGTTTRAVTLRLTGTAGTTPQIRVIEDQGGAEVAAWQDLPGAWNGATYTGTLTLPRAAGWWRVQTRYSEDTLDELNLGRENATRWAVGYKFLVLGQSQLTYWDSGRAGASLLDTGANVAFYEWHAYGINNSNPVAERLEILEDATISDGIATFANVIHAEAPGVPIQIVRQYIPGTSIRDLVDDSDATLSWSDLTDKTNKRGTDFTMTLQNWVTSNVAIMGTSGNAVDDPRAVIDITRGAPVTGAPFNVDNFISDICQPGVVHGISPPSRHSYFNPRNYTEALIDYANILGLPVGTPVSDYDIRDDGSDGIIDSAHPITSGRGNVSMGRSLGVTALKGLGLPAPENPYLPAFASRTAAGDEIRLAPVRPSGGTLTSDAPAALTGWSVSEDGGATWAGSGFTAAIDGTEIVLAKSAGTWAAAADLQVRKQSNNDTNQGGTVASEIALIDGELYEQIGGAVGRIPVHGVRVGGAWSMPVRAVIDSVTQAGAAGDSVPPVLTGLGAGTPAATATTASVTTDEGNGLLWYEITDQATTLAVVDLTSGGTSQAVLASGAQSIGISGLTAATAYRLHVVHVDAAGNASAVLSVDFSTAAAATGLAAIAPVGIYDVGGGSASVPLTSGRRYAMLFAGESGGQDVTLAIAGAAITPHALALEKNQELRGFTVVAGSTGTQTVTVNNGASRCALAIWDIDAREFVAQVSQGDNSGPADFSADVATLAGDAMLLVYIAEKDTTAALDQGFTAIDFDIDLPADRQAFGLSGIAAGGAAETFSFTGGNGSFANGAGLLLQFREI